MHKTLVVLCTCLAISPVLGATYCDSRGNSNSEWIAGVNVNGIALTSGSDGGYLNATGKSPFQLTGKGDRLEARPGFRGSQFIENWGVWIDFNQNGNFEASEKVLTGQGSTAVSASIVVPPGVTGTTRMRVQMRRGLPHSLVAASVTVRPRITRSRCRTVQCSPPSPTASRWNLASGYLAVAIWETS